MKRLGKFTGRVYDADYDFSKCPECCLQVSDEQAADEEFINQQHLRDLLDCTRCFGCPVSQGKSTRG